MQGGAITLAERYLASGCRADLIVATDMLDLPTFLAATRRATNTTPAALYFHENQLTFPPPPGTKRELYFGFVNYASAFVAARTFWNSAFHRDDFFDELPRLLKHYPDHTNLHTVAPLRERAEVLPPGVALHALDAFRPATPPHGPATILWNHRWEYDKNPEAFFAAIDALATEGLPFRLILAGESFRQEPTEFLAARERHRERIIHFGYAMSREAYARLLWEADIVVSTARHEFFGLATIEAMYCDCFPILPDRLAYPEYIPGAHRPQVLYRSQRQLIEKLRWAITNIEAVRQMSLRSAAEQYDWTVMAPRYDDAFARLIDEGAR